MMRSRSELLFVAVGLWISSPAFGTGDSTGDCEPTQESWLQPRTMVREELDGQSKSSAGGISGGGPTSDFLSTNQTPEGDGPDDVVYTPSGAEILIVHRETDNVTFFDANTRQYTHQTIVGDFPTDVAVSPNGQLAVTANVFSNSVSIIDIATHAVIAEVPITGLQPYRVAITPDSNFAVVGVINDAVNSSFSVVDLNKHVEVLSFPSVSQGVVGFYFTPESGGSGPLFTQFAIAADSETIVCPNRGGAQVALYSRTTGTEIVPALATAVGPTSIDISDDGTVAVIGHDSPGNAITEIDLVSKTVTGSFSTPILDGQVIRITPDKNHAIAGISNNVIFVNLTTGAIDTQINTGIVGDIEISFDGQYAFVSNFNARVIHIPSRTLAATIPFAACVEAACSPVSLKAVALNTRFREDIHFYSINGGASAFEGFSSTGAADEGDAARNLAISADGNTLVVCHNISRNVAIVDMPTQTIEAYVEVGDRPLAAAITPNGQYAVVCATDANAVKIIDLTTNSVVSTLPIFNRPSQVRISPDSQWAYVLNIAGGDRISFIQLNGAASSIVSQVTMGDAGSAQGYAYTEISGIELSSNGLVLAACDSFANVSGASDRLRLFDTVTRTQIAAVTVGDFPIRVAFNPAGTRAYVCNSFTDNVSVVNVNGAASSVIATVAGIEFPLVVEVDSSGSFVYVGNTDGNNPQLYVIDANTNAVVGSVPLSDPARDSHYSAAENVIYLALNDGSLARVNAAGAFSSVIDSVPLSAGPSDLVYSSATKTAIAAQPIPDGIDIIDYDPAAPCAPDIAPTGGNGTVDVDDLLLVINSWGVCAGECDADITQNDVVDVDDLLAVINAWGACD
jgi:YVTN family beta-propeller protein